MLFEDTLELRIIDSKIGACHQSIIQPQNTLPSVPIKDFQKVMKAGLQLSAYFSKPVYLYPDRNMLGWRVALDLPHLPALSRFILLYISGMGDIEIVKQTLEVICGE